MMFPFNCKRSLPSYEPLMPINVDVRDLFESPYNFCYGVLKKRMVIDKLLETEDGGMYRRGAKLVACRDEDTEDIMGGVLVVDLDLGNVHGQCNRRSKWLLLWPTPQASGPL